MVPSKRLELLRLSALPPQDSVSTNSTTTAFGTLALRQTLIRDLRGFLRGRRCRGSWRRGLHFALLVHGGFDPRGHAARPGRRRIISESEAGCEEDRCQHRRRTREEVGRARRAEEAARGAAAERRAHVGALAVLQQHEDDDAARGEHVQGEYESLHIA